MRCRAILHQTPCRFGRVAIAVASAIAVAAARDYQRLLAPDFVDLQRRCQKQLPSRPGHAHFSAHAAQRTLHVRTTALTALPGKTDRAHPAESTDRSPFGVLPGSAAVATFLTYPQTALAQVCLVIVAIAAFAIGTLQLDSFWGAALLGFENILNVVFFAEYCMRWYSRNCQPDYLLKWEMLIDAVAGVPLVLVTLGLVDGGKNGWALAFLRLFRLTTLQRYFRDTETFRMLVESLGVGSAIGRLELEFVRAVVSISTLLFISSGLMYTAEHDTNPDFPNFFVAVYFGLVTLTTVGFGDITPITAEGRALVCVSIIAGAAVIPVQLSALAEAFFERLKGKDTDVTSTPFGSDRVAEALARQGAQLDAIAQSLDSAGIIENRDPRHALDDSLRCKRCMRSGHLPGANFCFLCGSPLLGADASDADRDTSTKIASP